MQSINKVHYKKQAMEIFQSEIEKFEGLESGGVLIGHLEDDVLVIDKASNGGPNAVHEEFYFRADPNYVDMFIDMEIANSDGELRYIGEWHTHPQIDPTPSDLDLQSLYDISESSRDFCILLIIGAINFQPKLFSKQTISIIKHAKESKFYLLKLNP